MHSSRAADYNRPLSFLLHGKITANWQHSFITMVDDELGGATCSIELV